MTPVQRRLYDFLVAEAAEGRCPSLAEMARHLGYKTKSKGHIHVLISALVEQRLVKRGRRNTKRSLKVLVAPGRDPDTVKACAAVALEIIADHDRFAGIRVEAYSVASVIVREIYRRAGMTPPPMPDPGPPLNQPTGLTMVGMTIGGEPR